MIRKQMYKSVLSVTLGVFLFSCTEGGENKDEVIIEDVDTTAMLLENDEFESPDLDYHLPSALQVASIFKKSGMSYNADQTSSVDNVSHYTSDIQSKLNFGVYSADLAYCITNSQVNDARNFITAVQTLAEQQGMESVFQNKNLMERFDENLEINDSIQAIIVEIHERSQEYLEDNEMGHIAAVHYAGAWTEGMHLGYADYLNNKTNTQIGLMLAEQMEILDNIIKGLKDPKNSSEELAWIITDLSAIQSTFNEFGSVIAFYENGETEDINLTDVEINTLGKAIELIRTRIVEK